MSIVHEDSLYATLDALDEAWFEGREIAPAEQVAAARWIAARQGQPGTYFGLCAPTPGDFSRFPALFTGEPVKSRAGIGYVFGQEALRALAKLAVAEPEVTAALDRAKEGFLQRLEAGEAAGDPSGTYCCARCSTVLWRSLAAGGLPGTEERLVAGLQALKRERDGRGRWERYPYYHTLLALGEIGPALAIDEMRYAAPAAERVAAHRPSPDDRFGLRRQRVAEKLLALC